jgi:hypothetical protein
MRGKSSRVSARSVTRSPLSMAQPPVCFALTLA